MNRSNHFLGVSAARWAMLIPAVGSLLASVPSEARDAYVFSYTDWYNGEGYCYNHDEFSDTTPTMDARPSGQPSWRPIPDLDCWLTQAHPEIASLIGFAAPTSLPGFGPYAAWTAEQKSALALEFNRAWNWFEEGYPSFYVSPNGVADPPPTNLAPDSGETILDVSSAWSLYTQALGVMLAAQLGHWFTWDMRWEMWIFTEDLRQLLHSNYMFPYYSAWPVGSGTVDGYAMDFSTVGAVTPTAPLAQLAFLRENGMIHASPADTVYAALDWGRDNLAHFNGALFDPATMQAVWQYSGFPPVSSIISGTKSTASNDASFPALHWTAGCHGTSGFYKSVLRTAMIPVGITMVCGHSQMHFPMNWLFSFLGHSDDIYSQDFRDSNLGTPFDLQYPPTSAVQSTSYLTRFEADYASYYSPQSVSSAQACANVDVGSALFAGGIYGNQTNNLMADYCHDVANGLSHADGYVYQHNFVNPIFGLAPTGISVDYLETQNLWWKLDAKRLQYGCARFPPR